MGGGVGEEEKGWGKGMGKGEKGSEALSEKRTFFTSKLSLPQHALGDQLTPWNGPSLCAKQKTTLSIMLAPQMLEQ